MYLYALAASAIMLFANAANALEIITTINHETQEVRLDFTDIPADYVQIRMDGVGPLDWCSCIDSRNPSSPGSGGAFQSGGGQLELIYEGPPPPVPNNWLTYHWEPTHGFAGWEEVEWVRFSYADESEADYTAFRPILVELPEPNANVLLAFGVAGLVVLRRLWWQPNLRLFSPSSPDLRYRSRQR
jgi:hypothetical protein